MADSLPNKRPVILVVDDTPQHLSLMSDVLEGHYTVKLAPSGARALKITNGPAPPDLILLDIMMPEMDGYEVIQALKANPDTKHIPVIFLTARDDAEAEQRGLDLGAVDYITKPISPPVVFARVRNHLALRRQTEELEIWNRTLLQRVEEGVAERERLSRLRRFFSPAVANLLISGDDQDILRARQREIVVVFLDLRGYTEFTEKHGAEEVMRVLAEYHAAMGELILSHGGTLERFTGDGMMIFFNDPIEIEDPALVALRMSIAMLERIADLQNRWMERGYTLTMGIGIAQGIAAIGAIGFEGRRDYGAIGGVTNLSARLCGKAAGGQILVSETVMQNATPAIRFRSIGKMALKGFARQQEVFEVVAGADAQVDLELACDPAGFPRALEWVTAEAARLEVPEAATARLGHCLREALNELAARHGDAGRGMPVKVRLDLRRDESGGEIALSLADSGPPLDSLATGAAALDGNGLAALKEFAERVGYRRSDDGNILEVAVRWDASGHGDDPASQKFRRGPDRRAAESEVPDGTARGGERRREDYRWISLFRSVESGMLADIIGNCEVQSIRAGTPFLRLQENDQHVFILLSGHARIRYDGETPAAGPAVLTPGDCIGELSAITGAAVSGHVEAETDVRVLKLTHDIFWNRLMTVPGVAANLVSALSARQRNGAATAPAPAPATVSEAV